MSDVLTWLPGYSAVLMRAGPVNAESWQHREVYRNSGSEPSGGVSTCVQKPLPVEKVLFPAVDILKPLIEESLPES